ncbi:MAG: orotidine-5'-phosphate decarboxylase [Steroidobacteraceae bacterium]
MSGTAAGGSSPAPRRFFELLQRASSTNRSRVCIGLDPEPERFPVQFRGRPRAILEFNQAIVDATLDVACCYKPQFAHFAAERAEDQLEETIRYIRERAPDVPVILDAKRGDIGSTAEKYAREAFERYGADAVTVNPYLGGDALEPFLIHADKGVIVLCRTSNPGARDLQDLEVGGRKLYEVVADWVAREWNARGNCMLVVGATYPQELADLRTQVGDLPFLVPGVGAQGGDVERAVRSARTGAGEGFVISSSRAILYASTGEDFAAAARRAALELRATISAANS